MSLNFSPSTFALANVASALLGVCAWFLRPVSQDGLSGDLCQETDYCAQARMAARCAAAKIGVAQILQERQANAAMGVQCAERPSFPAGAGRLRSLED